MAHITDINQAALQQIMAATCAQTFVDIMRVEHSSIDTSRFVNDRAHDLERSDGIYRVFPFQVTQPAQTDEKPPELKIKVDTVDYRLVAELQSLQGSREKPTITVATVSRENPDDELVGPWTFYFSQFQTNGQTSGEITANLIPGALNNDYPVYRFTPSNAGE